MTAKGKAGGPRPGTPEWLRGKARGARRRALTRALEAPSVRRRLRARALRALARPEPVTFVCYGNICRSPFAEAVARRHLGPGRVVASSGTHPRGGRRSPEEAVDAALAWSVDLSVHRSRVVGPELGSGQGEVFVFDIDNLVALLRRFPGLHRRIHLLGALDGSGPLAIADPYGADREAFLSTYARIDGAIRAAAHSAPRDA